MLSFVMYQLLQKQPKKKAQKKRKMKKMRKWAEQIISQRTFSDIEKKENGYTAATFGKRKAQRLQTLLQRGLELRMTWLVPFLLFARVLSVGLVVWVRPVWTCKYLLYYGIHHILQQHVGYTELFDFDCNKIPVSSVVSVSSKVKKWSVRIIDSFIQSFDSSIHSSRSVFFGKTIQHVIFRVSSDKISLSLRNPRRLPSFCCLLTPHRPFTITSFYLSSLLKATSLQ
jgi:hypothetical protein